MHGLRVIENACLATMDEEEPDFSLFKAVADPQTMLTMADLIRKMLAYLERGDASGMTREELIEHVKTTCHIGPIAGVPGAVGE